MLEQLITKFLKLGLIIVVMIRIVAILNLTLGGVSMPGGIVYFMFRQVIYIAAWVSLLVFVSVLDSEAFDALIQKIIMLRKCAFWAMVLCAAKFIVLLVFIGQYGMSLDLVLANRISELAVWLMLVIFFYYYWKRKKKQQTDTDVMDV